MPAFGFSFDMRAPDFGTPGPLLYAEALNMVAWGDTNGIDYTIVLEHHGSSDGYLPAPFVMGAAIAARTSRMRIQGGAILLPLHDPVKIAEQIAVLDQISNGRLEVVIGAGYVRSEFAMFRRNLAERGKALDEGIPIIIRALSGERFRDGDREVFVRPLPVQTPQQCVLVGGGVPASAQRAARLGLGFCPMKRELIPLYREACAKRGIEPGPVRFNMGWSFISEDPEKTWHEIGPHVVHVVKSYAAFAQNTTSSSGMESKGGEETTTESVKKLGILQVMTPDEAVLAAQKADGLETDIVFTPLIGGINPDLGWRSLELFAAKVLPRLRSEQARSVPL